MTKTKTLLFKIIVVWVIKRYTSLSGKRTGSQDQKGVRGYSIRACSSQYPGREEKEKQDVDKKFGYRVGEAETAHKPKPCVKPVSSCLLPVFLLTLPPSLGASPSLIFSFTCSLPFLFHSKCLTPFPSLLLSFNFSFLFSL